MQQVASIRGSADRRAMLAIAGCCAYGVVLAWLATSRGIGVSPDSTTYLAAAQNLRDGRGLIAPWWDGRIVPLSHYPPLFPAVLAIAGRAGANLLDAARVLHALLFGVTIALAAGAVAQLARPLTWHAVLAAAIVATSLDLLTVHTMVWSEPLFLATGLAGLMCLGIHLHRWRWPSLVCAALLIASASLVRFPGVALMMTGGLALLGAAGRSWRERLLRTVVFSILAAGPLVLLFAFNSVATGHAANRPFAVHLLLGWRVRTALIAVSSWMMPGASCCISNGVIVMAGGGALVLVWAALALMITRSGSWPAVLSDIPTRVAAIFILSYVAVASLDMLVLDASQYFGDRLITPLFLAALIVAFAQLRRGDDARGGEPRRVARPAAAVAALLLVAGIAAQARYVKQARAHGLSYLSDAWQRSPTIAAIRDASLDTRIVSNRPDAVRFLAARPAGGAPLKRGIQTHLPNAEYTSEMDALAREVRAGRAIVAWFTADRGAEAAMASEPELIARFGPGRALADGVLFGSGSTP